MANAKPAKSSTETLIPDARSWATVVVVTLAVVANAPP